MPPDIDFMVGGEAAQGVQTVCHCESRFIGTKQSRGRVWGCHSSLAMTKVVLDKSGSYKMNHGKDLSYD
ncbi:MAG: hypothetical protein HXY36_01475 [Chloroflexi bacterium]|nr:hypothetical protein [Chloroflexota bacterium]